MFASDFVIAVALSDLSDWLITDGYFVSEYTLSIFLPSGSIFL